MGLSRATAKRFLVWAAVFLGGAVAGGLAVYAVSVRASGAYLTAAQFVFASAQEEQASEAWQAGNFDEALGHAFCGVEVRHGVGARRAFARNALPWEPFYLALLRTVIIDPNRLMTGDKPRGSSEASDRSRLAVAWERIGRQNAADAEFASVVRLTGRSDVSGWRKLGLDTIDLWSRVRQGAVTLPEPANADQKR